MITRFVSAFLAGLFVSTILTGILFTVTGRFPESERFIVWFVAATIGWFIPPFWRRKRKPEDVAK